jgi:hypothetical protein
MNVHACNHITCEVKAGQLCGLRLHKEASISQKKQTKLNFKKLNTHANISIVVQHSIDKI